METERKMGVVPIEPTDAMLEAARDWTKRTYGNAIGLAAAAGCWRSMIDAWFASDEVTEQAHAMWKVYATDEGIVFQYDGDNGKRIMVILDDEGLGYTIRPNDEIPFRPGKFEAPAYREIADEINASIQAQG